MKLTNKRLKHLAKRGKASIAEQRELAARVLQAEKPRRRGAIATLWDLSIRAHRDHARAETVVRLIAVPFQAEVIKPDSDALHAQHHYADELRPSLPRQAYEQEICRMARDLGQALFSDPRIERSDLLTLMLAVAPSTPETRK